MRARLRAGPGYVRPANGDNPARAASSRSPYSGTPPTTSRARKHDEKVIRTDRRKGGAEVTAPGLASVPSRLSGRDWRRGVFWGSRTVPSDADGLATPGPRDGQERARPQASRPAMLPGQDRPPDQQRPMANPPQPFVARVGQKSPRNSPRRNRSPACAGAHSRGTYIRRMRALR